MMQNKVIGIISKRPEHRGDREVKAVLSWLRKKSEILSRSDDDVLIDVVRNCAYTKSLQDDVIVTQGDIGDCFYIMLSGQTSVYIDTTKSDDDSVPPESLADAAHTDKVGEWASTVTSDDGHKKKKRLDRTQYGKFIRHFDEGKSFGEIALITEDSVRNATVIADDETDLLVIHRDLFNRSMKASQEKEYEERKNFINQCRLFSDWSSRFKHLLEMSIRKEEYPFGSRIMKQGDPVEGLYFIVSGQATVVMEPGKHGHQYPGISKKLSPIELELGRENKENHQIRHPGSFTQSQIRVKRKEGYAAAERRYMSRAVEVCCVEDNEIQGDMEVAMEMPTCACTVTCRSNTTVFLLDMKTYDRLVLKKNLHTVRRLKAGVLRKLRSRIATANGGQVPLLKLIHDKLADELKPVEKVSIKKQAIDDDRQAILTQMVQLYLMDKASLIDPLLPDSFYTRLKTDKRNKEMQDRQKRKEETDRLFKRRQPRIARSLKQLQNSAAENELLNPIRGWIESQKRPKQRHIRPGTAMGIVSHSTMEHDTGSKRPETASGYVSSNLFHLTECESTEELDQSQIGAKEKEIVVTEGYDQVFQHMDSFQREKNESRSKVICSIAAKTEIRNEVDRARLGYAADDMFHEDYFDWETSAPKLKDLEERIRTFCNDIATSKNTDKHPRVNEMKCFQVQGTNNVPMAGGTVFIKKKPCTKSRRTRHVTSARHQHVHRYMVTREMTSSSASLNARPQSAFASVPRNQKVIW